MLIFKSRPWLLLNRFCYWDPDIWIYSQQLTSYSRLVRNLSTTCFKYWKLTSLWRLIRWAFILWPAVDAPEDCDDSNDFLFLRCDACACLDAAGGSLINVMNDADDWDEWIFSFSSLIDLSESSLAKHWYLNSFCKVFFMSLSRCCKFFIIFKNKKNVLNKIKYFQIEILFVF